jgi:hypothetical protein
VESSRPILSLTKKKTDANQAGAEDRGVIVGAIDLLLPARQFQIQYKVAESGAVSLTTEFLLRLLYAAESLEEAEVASFFGFNVTELLFVLEEAEHGGYISRSNGRVRLADAGYALFKENGKPEILEVISRREKIGFDLISLAPCEREYLSERSRAFPELDISEKKYLTNAAEHVPASFRRHYSEISARKEREPTSALKKVLYSVDEVNALERFQSIVPAFIAVNVLRPSEPEPFLETWRVSHERDDRAEVVREAARFCMGLKRSRRQEDSNAYRILQEIAPKYLEDYQTRENFNAFKFLKEASSRVGEFRTDRDTIGIIGPLYLPENAKKVAEALRYANSNLETLARCVWVIPKVDHWGATTALETFIDGLSLQPNSVGKDGKIPTIGVSCSTPKLLQSAFHQLLRCPDNGAIPASLEVFIIPQKIAALIVHAPIGSAGVGMPVPIGMLSFSPEIVAATAKFLADHLPKNLTLTPSGVNFELASILESKSSD